jgi:2-hydroxychromene-2-carboxylate isomerase
MKLEVWFEFASPYSYLTVSRVEKVAREAGVQMAWRPFLLGPIFQAKGWATSPFLIDTVKGNYMWRDMKRRAKRQGIAFQRPSDFPAHSLGAARMMTAALDEPWCGQFARDVFHVQFAEGEDISDKTTLLEILHRLVDDPDHWIGLSGSAAVKSTLRANTDRATEIGLFGAPSFMVGDELFWGDDRLEDAVDWLKATKITQAREC